MWASFAPKTYPIFPTYPIYPRPFYDYHYDYKPFVINSGNFTTGGMTGSTTMFSSFTSKCDSGGHHLSKFSGQSEPTLAMPDETMETGRIEKGSESNQKFTNVDIDFESYCSHRVEYQILPLSQKKFVEAKDIRQYCISCGRRRKKSENFCPTDGAKYSNSIPTTSGFGTN